MGEQTVSDDWPGAAFRSAGRRLPGRRPTSTADIAAGAECQRISDAAAATVDALGDN
jgi:hypothetical protein